MSQVFLDTNIFIYFYEENNEHSRQSQDLFTRLSQRGDEILTSTLTIGELLVKPLRIGNQSLAELYERSIAPPIVNVIPFDRTCAHIFARVRQDSAIKPADAIQLACAASARCDLFITSDERLSRKLIPGIQFISSMQRAFV